MELTDGRKVFETEGVDLRSTKNSLPFAGSAKIMQVIVCRNRNAVNDDPNLHRIVTEIFDLDGNILASHDPYIGCYTRENVIESAVKWIQGHEKGDSKDALAIIDLLNAMIHY